jgi:SM-20-related protein
MAADVADLIPPFVLADAEVRALGAHGWFLRDDLLGRPVAMGVRDAIEALAEAGRLRPAGLGREAARRLDEAVRSDVITWVTPDDAPELGPLWNTFLALRDALNRDAYLGLYQMEAQAACYPAGAAGYRRHRDAFAATPGARPNRRVTAIYYANPGWRPEDGGALRLYRERGDGTDAAGRPTDAEPVDVAPLLDRLLVFLSERIEHEVLPTRAPRWAVTAWFRPRDALGR